MFLTQNQPAHKGVTSFSVLLLAGWEHVSITGYTHRLLDSIPVYCSSLFVVLKGLRHNGFSFILFAHHQPIGVHPALLQWEALEACTNLPGPNYKSVESYTTTAYTEFLKYVRSTESR